MAVRIDKIDCIAKEDVYRRGGEYTTFTELYINPEKRRCLVSQQSGAPGVGTPEDEWHKRVLTYDIGGGKEFGRDSSEAPDSGALREFLESKKGQKLLDRICDGHDINWDGHNMVGELDDDAESALRKLLSDIEDLPRSEWQTWTVEDYLGNVWKDYVKASMTDKEIEKVATEIDSDAKDEHIYVDGDIEDYLLAKRNELR